MSSEPIQLKNAGDKHTMDVASCEELPFGRYKEYEFVGRDGSRVRVPKASTERQLTRLELTPDSVVGRRVTLKRDPSSDPAKPWWGLYLEDGNGSGAGAAKQNGSSGPASAGTAGVGRNASPPHGEGSAPATTPVPQNGDKQEASGYKLYRQITEKVLADLVPLYEKHGVKPDAQTVAAICATVFIQASRH